MLLCHKEKHVAILAMGNGQMIAIYVIIATPHRAVLVITNVNLAVIALIAVAVELALVAISPQSHAQTTAQLVSFKVHRFVELTSVALKLQAYVFLIPSVNVQGVMRRIVNIVI